MPPATLHVSIILEMPRYTGIKSTRLSIPRFYQFRNPLLFSRWERWFDFKANLIRDRAHESLIKFLLRTPVSSCSNIKFAGIIKEMEREIFYPKRENIIIFSVSKIALIVQNISFKITLSTPCVILNRAEYIRVITQASQLL